MRMEAGGSPPTDTALANASLPPLSEKLKSPTIYCIYLKYQHIIKPNKMIYHSKPVKN